jgi:hypothetical protein
MRKLPVHMIKNALHIFFILVCLAVLLTGCRAYEARISDESPTDLAINTLAVFGFLSVPFPAEEGNTVRSPLTGSVFIQGSVPLEIPEQLTAQLYDLLSTQISVALTSPDVARQALSTVKNSYYGSDDRELLRKTGESLSVDAFLAGHVFRWQGRIGTDFSVSRPASVAFELALFAVADGSLLWKGRFDKTQASLTENILDLTTFLKGKGRWMSTEDLAKIGLSELAERLPIGKKE